MFDLNKPIIIGGLTFEFEIYDSISGISLIEIYIDGMLKENNIINEWYLNENIFGKHEIRIEVIDKVGNNNSYSKDIIFFIITGNR